jgi:hypothetical protein
MRRKSSYLGLSGLVAAALLGGCSMSTEWHIRKTLHQAGFSRVQTRCAIEGIRAQLSRDQLWELRGPLLKYTRPSDPTLLMDEARLLERLRGEVSPEVHHVVTHHLTHCVKRPDGA